MAEPLNTKAWVLVPVEPTEEMMRAGCNASVRDWATSKSTFVDDPTPVYRAMLSASPDLPAADGGELVERLVAPVTMSQFATKTDLYMEILQQRKEAAALIITQKQEIERWKDTAAAEAEAFEEQKTLRHAAESRVQSLEEEVKVLREALRPFADFSTADGEGFEDELFRIHDDHPLLGEGLGDDWHPVITVGDMRRARAALKENGNG